MDRILKSKYKITGKLCESDRSITYRGSHAETGANLLIKIFKRSYLNSILTKKLKKDISVLSRLEHPSVPRLLDGDYGWQGFYFVREFVEGSDFSSAKKPLEVEKARGIAEGICEALEAAHKSKIVHGNLSPGNIFLEGSKIKVADFGINAAVNSSIEKLSSTLMEKGSAYLSPEEILGQAPDVSSDIYKLGIFMYLCLTGCLPFSEEKRPVLAALKKVRCSPQSPSALNPKVPKFMDDIVMKCLERDPLLRFPSASYVKESLENSALMLPHCLSIEMPELGIFDNGKKETPEEKKKEAEKKEFEQAEGRKSGRSLFRWMLAAFLASVAGGIIYSLVQILVMGE